MATTMKVRTIDSSIRIVVEKVNTEPALRFSGLEIGEILLNLPFPSSREKAVVQMLGARLSVLPEKGEILLLLHGDLD